jgi:uncharacterized membrane protein
MQSSYAWFVFIALLAVAALVIFLTGQSLPDVVASHFSSSGVANGRMSRDAYLTLMIGVAAGLPLAINVLQTLLLGASASLKLPNSAYWLAPERKATTLAFLRLQSMTFGVLLAAFLCFVHLCVVDAHSVTPARISSSVLSYGLVAYLLATVVWIVAFFYRFNRIR